MEAQKGNPGLMLVVSQFQGHITPMLQLATILYSKGFSITIVHPKLNSPDPSNHPDFTFLPLSENLSGIDASGSFITYLEALNNNCKAQLQEHYAQMIGQQGPKNQLVGVIYDNLMYFAESVASDLNLPSIMFRSSGASYARAYLAIPRLNDQGYFPLQDSMLQELVPELHPLKFKDLPLINSSIQDALQLLALTARIRNSYAIIWNTMDYLENSVLSELQRHYEVPIFSVGPLHKMAPGRSTSILEEDTSCLAWLDMQAPQSVIYVSLGSTVIVNEKELVETAWGLANSDQPFLWVIRPGSVRGSQWIEFLPESFTEKMRERGCILKWAPQKEVLSHVAVGGFWSHCGWNSTLESISEGVPMICSPFYVDQKVNARYISSVWNIGLQLDHLEKEEIESAIRKLLVGKEGKEMRQKATDMKEKAKVAVSKGGSSYNSLNDLVEFITTS